jgi:hypothetical protein
VTFPAALIAELTEHQPQVVELAGCLSLAVSVDRPFLRRARLRFLPRTTAGLEAELWFSPLVDTAGRQSLLLDAEAAEQLRTMLARNSPELLSEIRAFTSAEHVHAPLVVRLYEELLWSGLDLGQTDETQVARQAHRVLRAVSGQGVSEAVADDTGRWALHCANRLPGHLLARDGMWDIHVAACERLGLEPPEAPAADRFESTARARARVQRTMPVGVAVRSDGLVLSRPPAGARILRAKGTRHRVRLDVRSSLSPVGEPVRLNLGADQSTHLTFTVVQRIGPDGEVRMSLSHPGTALDIAVSDHVGTGPGAAHCAVLLHDGTIVLHDGAGVEQRRIPADGSEGARSFVELSQDGNQVSYVHYGEELHQMLTPTSRYVPGVPRRLRGSDLQVTARLPSSGMKVQAFGDGRVTVSPASVGGRISPRDIGFTPWQASSLAVSRDERWVAVVGNDSLLLELPLDPDQLPRETRLRFCVTSVEGCADGSWVVIGHGGPMEVLTEDGGSYQLIPDLEPAAHTDGRMPSWGRGCVLVRARAERLDDVVRLPDVECVLVHPPGSTPAELAALTAQVATAHRHSVRVVLVLDLTAVDDALPAVRQLLDDGVDGLAFPSGIDVPAALLDDIRHLVDGYDDRILLWDNAPVTGRVGGLDVLPASALVAALGLTLRSRERPGGALDHGMARLRNEIEATFPRPAQTSRAAPPFQWSLELPPPLPGPLAPLATAILLSLPGCPVLPAGLLLADPAENPVPRLLLELRRDHLALSRGDCEVVDVGSRQTLAVVRRYGDDALLCLANLGPTRVRVALDPARLGGPARLQDAFDGALLALPDETPLSLPPSSFRWFRLLAP